MIVRDVDQLRQLTLGRRGSVYVHRDVIRLEIPGISGEERRRLEIQLNDHIGACGCDGGAVALGVTLGAYAMFRGLLGVRVLRGPLRESAAWTIVGVALTAVGKTLALRRSHRIVTEVGRRVERAQAIDRVPVVPR